MKQIVLVSGKGGTGKSTIAACLAQLVPDKMLADCDVDTPNLHLLLHHTERSREDYSGASVAKIDPDRCIACGRCLEACRFDAITPDFMVRPLACEGCAACTVVCPTDAISLHVVKTGSVMVSDTDYGTFAHAQLDIGAEGSGKLVTAVRKKIFENQSREPIALIDGSPGIGCVIIASITGTDAVIAVAEATQSGRHDLERVLAVADHFKVPSFVCINKWDLNEQVTAEIEAWCAHKNVPVLAKIPFDPDVMAALQQGLSPVDAGLEDFTNLIRQLWQNLLDNLA